MNKIREWNISTDFTIAEIDKYPTDLYKAQLAKQIFGEYPSLPWQEQLSENETKKIDALKKNVSNKFQLRLALLKNEELVGWTYGYQDTFDDSTFFMGASMVLPEYRKQGFYTALANKVIEITKEAGFQSIWSTHLMNNNAIMIAKLKLGFGINGFEMNVNYGNLVKLTYHHSELRQRALKYRAGAIQDEEIKDLLMGEKSKLTVSSIT